MVTVGQSTTTTTLTINCFGFEMGYLRFLTPAYFENFFPLTSGLTDFSQVVQTIDYDNRQQIVVDDIGTLSATPLWGFRCLGDYTMLTCSGGTYAVVNATTNVIDFEGHTIDLTGSTRHGSQQIENGCYTKGDYFETANQYPNPFLQGVCCDPDQ